MPPDIVFFDGVCGMCNRLVRFVIRRDGAARFRFAPIQSERAREILARHGRDAAALDSMFVLTAEGRLLDRSRAVFHVLAGLGGGWRLVAALRVLPRPLAEVAYRVVARLRYRLFGKHESCPLPTAAERGRFLEDVAISEGAPAAGSR